MPSPVSPEQFDRALPCYVDRAHKITHRIIQRALAHPKADLEIQATLYGAEPPDYRENIFDKKTIENTLRSGQRLEAIKVDAPLDSSRLAIEYIYSVGNVRSWIYRVPHDTSRPERWIDSGTRKYLGNLALPGYGFVASPGHGWPPDVYTYVFSPQDAKDGKNFFNSASSVSNVPKEDFKNAIAPPYTSADAQLLEQGGVETYHTAKIELLLRAMGSVAAHR